MILGLNSCKDKVEPDGIQEDTIKLSTTELTINSNGGIETVTSEGKYWHIEHSICIGEKWYGIGTDNGVEWYLFFGTEGNYEKFVVEMDSLSTYNIVKIKGPWFTISKETSQSITFSILPNTTENVRTLILNIHDRNYGTGIIVTQTAE
ncbi:hypothetical protein FACS1894156_7450 [Bacteroidia bacterium]|nr:hypothetical protein FACS1894156_7450 [Bacteroidia bacterium]